jgi:ribonuclease R
MSLLDKILKLLARPDYQPLEKVGISKALGIEAGQRRHLRDALAKLEREGRIARIRKNYFVLPVSANLVTGTILAFSSGNAKLIQTDTQQELFLTPENLGTAMHGDRVVARLVHEGRMQPREGASLEGRVVRILEVANPTIVGTVAATKGFLYVIPDDPRLCHDIYIRKSQSAHHKLVKEGEKVVVRLDPWESRHVSPEGEVIEVLGGSREPGVDLLSLMRRYNLPERFPEEVQAQAETISEVVRPEDYVHREDFREQPVITIDPDDAKDYDDAIHVERRGTGWRLNVHIADVAHYVGRGSALDKEARSRGNSTYLAGRVIPMLPERLSNGVCSLKPGVERLAFSAIIEFNADGQPRSARFARTVIRSIARLTYKQAFAILGGETQLRADLPTVPEGSRCYTDPFVQEQVRVAWEFAQILRKKRFEAGSLDLDFPEVKVWLDTEGRPERLEKIENDPSHQLVEECMLAANEAVAATLKRAKTPAVYRVHEVPDPDKLQEFREKALRYGCRVGDLTQRREVQKLLRIIRGKPEEYLLKLEFLKSLKRAAYGVVPLGHYGLAKVNYTHFTSPIRRYADLLVHRALAGESAGRAGELGETAAHISSTERQSAEAEKESVQRKKLEFFERQLRAQHPEVFAAVIIDVRSHGLVVELPDVLFTGMIHVSRLPDDFYTFDATRLQFRGKRGRNVFELGERLEVKVCRVDVFKKQVDFQLSGNETIIDKNLIRRDAASQMQKRIKSGSKADQKRIKSGSKADQKRINRKVNSG